MISNQTAEKILFYNLSGMCELRINKKNIEHNTYDECVYYVRRKLKDISITAIKNLNTKVSYNDILFNDILFNDSNNITDNTIKNNDIPNNDMKYNIIIRNTYREKVWHYYYGK
jgi:hypothetical protein